jgi:hypothetical protein
MSAKSTLDALDAALFDDDDGSFGHHWSPDSPQVTNDNLLINKGIGHFGHLCPLEEVDMSLKWVTKEAATVGVGLASTSPFLVTKVTKVTNANDINDLELVTCLSEVTNGDQKSAQNPTGSLTSSNTAQPRDGNADENRGPECPETVLFAGGQDDQSSGDQAGQPAADWTPFDWGEANRRFERFRRCPLLCKPEGAS